MIARRYARSRYERRRRRTPWIGQSYERRVYVSVLFAGALLLALGGLVLLLAALGRFSSGPPGPLARATLWARGPSPTVTYPRGWTVIYPDDSGGAEVSPAAFLSNSRRDAFCLPRPSACSPFPYQIAPGQVFVAWDEAGIPGAWAMQNKTWKQRIAGVPAIVTVYRRPRLGAGCPPGTDVSIWAGIRAKAAVDNWWTAGACIRGPHAALLESQALAMIRSFSWA